MLSPFERRIGNSNGLLAPPPQEHPQYLPPSATPCPQRVRRLPTPRPTGNSPLLHPHASGWMASLTYLAVAPRAVFPPVVTIHVVRLACERPDLFGRSLSQWDCAELAWQLIADGLVADISAATIRRILAAHQLNPVPPAHAVGSASQKKSLHAAERDAPRVQQAPAHHWQIIEALDVRRLQCVDESGVNLAMTRLYGRAPRGERVVGSVPQNYGQNVTVWAALGPQGLQAMMTVEGATDAEVFRADVKHGLGPTLAPGDIVVLDNLGAHKAVGIQQMLARRRVRLLYLPPDSPDLSPIEPCWSKVKTGLRTAKARTREALETALGQDLATVTAVDAHHWFRHCGDVLH
jgi:transposase